MLTACLLALSVIGYSYLFCKTQTGRKLAKGLGVPKRSKTGIIAKISSSSMRNTIVCSTEIPVFTG